MSKTMSKSRWIAASLGLVSLLLCSAAAPGLALAADDPELARAVQLFEAGKLVEAKPLFEAVARKSPQNAGAAFYLGRIALAREDIEGSVQLFERAAGIEGANSNYHMWLGRAYAEKAIRASVFKKPFLARSVHKEFEKAVDLDPANLDARFALIRFYLLAPRIMGGSVDGAMAQAEEIAKRDPMKGHQARAQVFQEEKKFDRAEQEYLTAIKEAPQNRDARFMLGLFYQEQKTYDKAFEIFEAMVKTDPPERRAYYQIGKTGLLAGTHLDRAEECLKLYLANAPKEGEPSFAWAHFRLGMVYEKKGSKSLAKQEYEETLKLQPDHKDAKEALKKIS